MMAISLGKMRAIRLIADVRVATARKSKYEHEVNRMADLTYKIRMADLIMMKEKRDKKICEILLAELKKVEANELVPYLEGVSINEKHHEMSIILKFPFGMQNENYEKLFSSNTAAEKEAADKILSALNGLDISSAQMILEKCMEASKIVSYVNWD